MQFGGQTVEFVKHVAINERELLVVALGTTEGPTPSDAVPGRVPGRVVVYEWLGTHPVLVQTLDAEANP